MRTDIQLGSTRGGRQSRYGSQSNFEVHLRKYVRRRDRSLITGRQLHHTRSARYLLHSLVWSTGTGRGSNARSWQKYPTSWSGS
jgi:hypothetical protein